MRVLTRFAIIVSCLVGLACVTNAEPLDGAKIVPTKMCGMCHKKADVGNQYAKWESGPHAKAFESLKSDEAKEVAKKLGVDDPTTSPKCLVCHSTAYGFTEAQVTTKLKVEEGVDCQSCHGPGKDYAAKHKNELKKAKTDAERAEIMAKLGMHLPTEANTCSNCHNKNNPTYNPERYKKADGTTTDFDFEQAAAKIAHPMK